MFAGFGHVVAFGGLADIMGDSAVFAIPVSPSESMAVMATDIHELHDQVVAALEGESPSALHAQLSEIRSADIAEVMDLLDDEQRSRLIYALPPRVAAEVVVELDEAVRGEVVEDLDDEHLSKIVTEMPPDDAADVVAELSLEQFGEILEHIPQAHSEQISELLTYGEATAGGIMNPRFVSLSGQATVREAIEEVRKFALDEDLHNVYVVDDGGRLLGILPLRRLVMHPPATRLSAIYDDEPVTVRVEDDQEHVLQVIRKYDIAAVPVLDVGGKLVGRVTYDDVMDVAEEEAAEDIYRMAGTDAAELETHSPFRAARIRMFWLVPCMIGTACAGGVVAAFRETALSPTQFAALFLFVPMIAATSGNAGIQVSAIILRGFATGELVAVKLGRVFLREFPIAVLVGLLCAVVTCLLSGSALAFLKGAGAQVATPGDVSAVQMGVAVGLGMLCAIGGSVGLGISLPFVFRRLGIDPAIASGPLITSLNDLMSVAVYLLIALVIVT